MAFKVAITGIFIFSATHLCNDYLDYKLTTEGYESIESKNFNYIKTSKHQMKTNGKYIDCYGRAT